MPSARSDRFTISLLIMLLAAVGACGEEEGDPCGEPVYGGEATDEAWRTMVDGEDRAALGDPNAPVLATPTEAQVFASADAPPRLAWSSTIALGPHPEPAMQLASAPRPASDNTLLEDLWAILVPPAHAHLPPITGDVYYLQIAIPEQECTYRVLTTDLEWQVDAEAWAAMGEVAGQDITLDIMSAYLTENRITEGPYKPAAVTTFSVSP